MLYGPDDRKSWFLGSNNLAGDTDKNSLGDRTAMPKSLAFVPNPVHLLWNDF